jgi:hypothetical protein
MCFFSCLVEKRRPAFTGQVERILVRGDHPEDLDGFM